MKKLILVHCVLGLCVWGLFFGLGSLDKRRLETASLENKPTLLFSHQKLVAEDGGSIWCESIIYSAQERRRMRVWKEEGETVVAAGFQGVSWRWDYGNLVWLSLLVGASFVGSSVVYLWKRG